jgi:hypothetical protein
VCTLAAGADNAWSDTRAKASKQVASLNQLSSEEGRTFSRQTQRNSAFRTGKDGFSYSVDSTYCSGNDMHLAIIKVNGTLELKVTQGTACSSAVLLSCRRNTM